MNEIYTRNKGVFSQEQMESISKTKITVFGCGLGSVIAELALRSGFEHITLVDGDTIDVSNLNRQMYLHSDVNKYKAEVMAERLKKINPEGKIDYINEYVSADNLWHHNLIKSSDIIIDTVDISSIKAMIDIHRTARTCNVPVVFPLNMGYSGGVFLFTSSSVTLENMLHIDDIKNFDEVEELYINKSIFWRWAEMCSPYLNIHNKDILKSFIDRVETEGWCPLPQLGIAAYTSAIISVVLLVKIAVNTEIRPAPYMHIYDAWEI